MTVIVSFYTPEWEYRSRAEQLMRDCDRLELAHDIQPRQSMRSWNRNTAMKPRFIAEMLKKHEHIIWLDCDGTLHQRPELCLTQPRYTDFMAVPHQTMNNHATSPRAWHTGLLAVQRTMFSTQFVDFWASMCEKEQITDELGFELVAQGFPGTIKALPPQYLRIIQWGASVGDTIYNMGISTSPDKMAMKARQRARGGDRG